MGDPRPAASEQVADIQAQYGIEKVEYIYEHVLKGFAAIMSAEQASEVATDPRVAFVEPDGVVTSAAATDARSGTS